MVWEIHNKFFLLTDLNVICAGCSCYDNPAYVDRCAKYSEQRDLCNVQVIYSNCLYTCKQCSKVQNLNCPLPTYSDTTTTPTTTSKYSNLSYYRNSSSICPLYLFQQPLNRVKIFTQIVHKVYATQYLILIWQIADLLAIIATVIFCY